MNSSNNEAFKGEVDYKNQIVVAHFAKDKLSHWEIFSPLQSGSLGVIQRSHLTGESGEREGSLLEKHQVSASRYHAFSMLKNCEFELQIKSDTPCFYVLNPTNLERKPTVVPDIPRDANANPVSKKVVAEMFHCDVSNIKEGVKPFTYRIAHKDNVRNTTWQAVDDALSLVNQVVTEHGSLLCVDSDIASSNYALIVEHHDPERFSASVQDLTGKKLLALDWQDDKGSLPDPVLTGYMEDFEDVKGLSEYMNKFESRMKLPSQPIEVIDESSWEELKKGLSNESLVIKNHHFEIKAKVGDISMSLPHVGNRFRAQVALSSFVEIGEDLNVKSIDYTEKGFSNLTIDTSLPLVMNTKEINGKTPGMKN